MKNNKNRNFSYLKRIKEHYKTLSELYNSISKDNFLNDTIERRAILFDLLQIGELVSQLTNNLQLSMDKDDFSGIISVRNHIVHGYDKLNNDIIIQCIEQELFPFIECLERNMKKIYIQTIKNMVGHKITILVDKEKDNTNYFNIGHINELSGLDGCLQKVLLLDVMEPIYQCKATVVGAIVDTMEKDYILLSALLPVDKEAINISKIRASGYKKYNLL